MQDISAHVTNSSIKIGDYTVTAFSDGAFQTTIDVTVGIDKETVQKISGKSLTEPVFLPVNAFLIEGRGVRALVDVGCGDTMGPALGKLPENLVAAGKSLDSITHVLLTHIHPDHSNGLIDGAGNAYYPNAEIAVQDIEYRFGVERDLSEAKYERQRENMVRAKASVVPYAKQITRIADGEFLPGILAQMSPGHTAGHSVWIVEGGGESVMIWGDTLHMPFLQLQRPDIGFVFDADPQQAAKSRLQLLDQTSADGTRVAGMHQDFPGYGYVKRRGDRFVIEQAR